ncbi:helix-turn-helix transcriptional regulator [Rossellomorea marisflavi]|uniref:Helix-turn-helix transcriptional regulator n=1 Tax=Rossellomorea marisflavi TaxID=189381 RepID=A0A5D4S2N7_9BACI|nr:helix-turn-helix transcriptional regulator [Rossellomorea marisflavi]TYS56418.1 helix-turn-helix transcriptional regulator [Rossellomorea marisflavi]
MLTGKQLKIQRIIKDIKAIEVSQYLDIHKSYFSKLENEVQKIPQHVYEKWSEYLGIN